MKKNYSNQLKHFHFIRLLPKKKTAVKIPASFMKPSSIVKLETVLDFLQHCSIVLIVFVSQNLGHDHYLQNKKEVRWRTTNWLRSRRFHLKKKEDLECGCDALKPGVR